MYMKQIHSAAILLTGLLAAFSPIATRAQTLAITGATIIDGTGRDPVPDGVVLISDGRIRSIGASRDVSIPRAARKIDARGKFIVPGLMDANIHLNHIVRLETLIRFEDRYNEIALEAAQVALKNGLTTVFDTCGQRTTLIDARDRINAGKVPGSRIYLAGYIIGFSGPVGPDFRDPAALAFVSKAFVNRVNAAYEEGIGPELLWMSPEQVRPIVREYAHRGVDFLKYGSSGHGAWPDIRLQYIAFSTRVQHVIVEEGHNAGITVQAHTTSPESLDMAIEAGADIITHGDVSGLISEVPEETLRKLVQRHIPVSVIPVTRRYLDAELENLAKNPPKAGHTWPEFQKLARINQTHMIKAGVTLLLSTDGGLANPALVAESSHPPIDPMYIGEGHFNALVSLEEQGMAPMDILKAATINIARAYKVDGSLGTLEVGKLADLLILTRDPLASARNYRSIETVIKEGRAVDRDALPLAPIIGSKAPKAAKGT
jgi:imidazolonepropionase-like amidohydrolase